MENFEPLSSSSSEDELEKRLKPLSLQEGPIFLAGARVVDNVETAAGDFSGKESQPDLSDRIKHIKTINKKNWIARNTADAAKHQQPQKAVHVSSQYVGLPLATATQRDDPDNKAAWAKYLRYYGKTSEAMKLESELERENVQRQSNLQYTSQNPDVLHCVAALEDQPYLPEYPLHVGSFENFPALVSEMNANKYMQPQEVAQNTPHFADSRPTIVFEKELDTTVVNLDEHFKMQEAHKYQSSEVAVQPGTLHSHPQYGAEQVSTKYASCVGKVKTAEMNANKIQETAQIMFEGATQNEQQTNAYVQFHTGTGDVTGKENENKVMQPGAGFIANFQQLQLLQPGPSGMSHGSELPAAQSSSGGMLVSRRGSSSGFILGDRLPSNQEDKITSLLMSSVNNDKESQTVRTENTTVTKKDAECQTIGTGDVIYLNLYTGTDFGYIKLEEVEKLVGMIQG